MNHLKSLFITAFAAYTVAVLAVSALVVAAGGNLSIWISVFGASAQVVAYFAWLHIAKVPRTSPGLMGFTVGIFAATMYSVFTSYDQQSPSVAPLLAFIVMVGWMGYVTWYSDLGERSSDRIRVGKKIPNLPLVTLEGNPVSFDDWAGQKRLVIFYLGNWSAICMGQIAELAKFRERFETMGVRITLISPQPQFRSQELAERVGTGIDFLSDPDSAAADRLGIVHEGSVPAGLKAFGYDSKAPMPTAFVIDEKGRVIYADLTTNLRLRPMPQDILKSIS